MNRFALVAVAAVFIFGAAASASTGMEDLMTVKTQLDKFSPVTIKVDSKLLDARQKKMVKELVAAADYIDKIFLMQVYENNYEIKKKLEASKGKKSALLEYFKINYGPFDRLDHDKPFVEGVGFKPLGANFYPSDMTKDEFEKWLKKRPKDRPGPVRLDGQRLGRSRPSGQDRHRRHHNRPPGLAPQRIGRRQTTVLIPELSD